MRSRSSHTVLKAARALLLGSCLVVSVAAMASAQTAPVPSLTDTSVSVPHDTAAVAHPDTAAVVPAPAVAPVATPPPSSAPAATPPPTTTQVSTSSASVAAAPEQAGMFSKGRRRVSGTVGWSHTLGNDYMLVGVGVGYFIANGLDAGVDFEGWFFGDPTVYKLSPRIDYVMWRSPRIKPYAGAFYRWNFIGGGLDDLSSLGGRAGVFYKGVRGGMAGGGVVYERYLNCDESIYHSCNVYYPEVFVAMSF
jgi:hypothetical protein